MPEGTRRRTVLETRCAPRPDVLVDATKRRLEAAQKYADAYQIVVFTDVRFENEVDFVRRTLIAARDGAKIIRLPTKSSG